MSVIRNLLKKFIYILFSAITLVASMGTSYAVEEELCTPFKEIADQSTIDGMLKAAKFNQLYRIKPDNSEMSFCVNSSLGLVKGEFSQFKGGVSLSGINSQTMVSIDVDSLNTNIPFIENILHGDTFFDSENHPKLIFVSNEFHWLDSKNAVLKGELTMRDVTKEIAFYITISDDNELGDSGSILIKANTTVQRSEFGMNAMSPLVSDKISLCMTIEAERYIAS